MKTPQEPPKRLLFEHISTKLKGGDVDVSMRWVAFKTSAFIAVVLLPLVF